MAPICSPLDMPHGYWRKASDAAVAHKALRRLALHALFFRESGQRLGSEGIGFEIAPELYFHQSTDWLNHSTSPTNAISGLQIPADLLLPTHLDAAEQAFLVRDYRDVLATMRQYVMGDYFAMFKTPFGKSTDTTFLPLFEAATREDPTLQCLHVQGRKVAHFPHRQAAAENIVTLTGKPASYLGLTGETLAANQVPSQPYPDQDLLVARFLLDRIQAANLKERPATDRDWSRVGYFNDLIMHLIDEQQFGAGLKNAILFETENRKLGPTLKNAGFSLWR